MSFFKFVCSGGNPDHTHTFPYTVRICAICGELGDSEKLPEKRPENAKESESAKRIKDQVLGFQ